MVTHGFAANVDDLLDQAGDAVARNDWALAKRLAESVLRQAPQHPDAALVLRTATTYLETAATGDPLSASRDLRFMSIMFCDVVESTRLARLFGDSAWRETLERFRRRCARAVRRYDGYVHEASGDELLILFGYPRVREDDARRAVLAGLDIVSAVRSLSALLESERGLEFHVRVGIHTGRALIRDRAPVSTADASIGDGLVGTAANIAKRIETAARPDTVWVSGATKRIVEGFFEFTGTPDGTKQVPVVDMAPVSACEVSGRTAALNRHQIARVRSDEMIGRLAERERLLELWEQARGDGAPFVVVSGHAGIGKSRLVEFIAEAAAADQGSRWECICTEILQPVAFAPLIALVERFANIRQTDGVETRLAKLDAAYGELAPELRAFVPYLAWMMSISRPEDAGIENLEPEVVRDRIFAQLLALLRRVAAMRPALLWIEDIQWADHSTQEFCRRLAAHGPIPGLLVVATVRTEYEQLESRMPPRADLVPGAVVRIDLDPLTVEEARCLIATRSRFPLDEALATAILDSTGGNPLYIEEVVHSVIAGGDVPHLEGPDHSAIGVPESLQPIFAHLVDRLGDDRHVAQIASLLGRELPEPLSRAVIARILGLKERQVVAALARLIDLEIIEPILTELTPGHRFRHELIREALAHSVGPDAKRSYARIAHVIEESFPDTARERPALLAYHLTRAGEYERAAAYWLKAGLALQSRAAHLEAIASFDQGLDALSRAQAPGDVAAHSRLELSLCASRGVSVQTTSGYTDPRAVRDWSRAYELSKQLRAEGAFVPALLGLWSFHFVQGAHPTSLDVANQIVDAAAAIDDVQARIIGYVCLGHSQYFQGRLVEGRQSLERSRELREQGNGPSATLHVPQDPALAGLGLLAACRWSLGDQLGALEAAAESQAVAIALETRRAINLARIGQSIAWLHQIRRAPRRALGAAERALAVAREHGIEWAAVNLSIHRGLALAHLDPRGAGGQARTLARDSLAAWRAAGAETMVTYFLGTLAEAYHLAGEHTAALELVEEALELGRSTGEHFHDAELYRVRGEAKLSVASERRDSGLDDLLDAVKTARDQHARSFEIRALVALLTAAPELARGAEWRDRLGAAVGALQSSEAAEDELAARALMAK